MLLIIGLGNPEKQHEKNRHNTGFIILEELRKLWDFPDFVMNKKFNAEISEGNSKLILARPQTFMNNSGEAMKKIMDFYKLTPQDIVVIHDDLDIETGKYKIATDSSSAGHKGVESIIEKIGTQEFKRIRIGIEGDIKRQERKVPAEDFVLQNFPEEELKVIKNIAKEIRQKI
jgi:PTH1 family peptidyl-tRNA hydrolase